MATVDVADGSKQCKTEKMCNKTQHISKYFDPSWFSLIVTEGVTNRFLDESDERLQGVLAPDQL